MDVYRFLELALFGANCRDCTFWEPRPEGTVFDWVCWVTLRPRGVLRLGRGYAWDAPTPRRPEWADLQIGMWWRRHCEPPISRKVVLRCLVRGWLCEDSPGHWIVTPEGVRGLHEHQRWKEGRRRLHHPFYGDIRQSVFSRRQRKRQRAAVSRARWCLAPEEDAEELPVRREWRRFGWAGRHRRRYVGTD
jgi:hypothetical protein